MRKLATLLALLLIGALAFTACGNDEASDPGGDQATKAARFNDADVAFAQEMILHHEQAVVMAQMAATRAESTEVEQFAADIEAAQDPEIATMTAWLEDWGQDSSSDGMDHGDMGHGSSSEMPGMMDEDDMTDLEGAMGAGWDRMFLTMMIEHHEGAIEMAQVEQADGDNPEAIALAEKIESDQTSEIAFMRDLLSQF